jgi:hypothetical protein
MKKRFLIAYDGRHVFFRETLSILHDGTRGEVQYSTKPAKPTAAMRLVMFIFELVIRFNRGKQ